jgi:hypothetical protein
MKRRSKIGGKGRKAHGLQTAKRPTARKETRGTVSSGARGKASPVNWELKGAREQLTATSEVLHAISSSHGELKPIFQSMLKHATRLCEAKFGNLYRWDNGAFSSCRNP